MLAIRIKYSARDLMCDGNLREAQNLRYAS